MFIYLFCLSRCRCENVKIANACVDKGVEDEGEKKKESTIEQKKHIFKPTSLSYHTHMTGLFWLELAGECDRLTRISIILI